MSTSRTWSGFRTTASVGGFASSRCQTSTASSGGASASSTATSPPVSTTVDVTGGGQWARASQSGCATRQIQRPGATSTTASGRAEVDVLRLDRAGSPPRGRMVAPVQIGVRDYELRRRRAPGREILGGVRVAHERRVVTPDERAVERRADALVRLRSDDDEPSDAEAG